MEIEENLLNMYQDEGLYQKPELLNKRGGHLYCRLTGNGRIAISGEAALVAVSDIVVKP